MRLEIHLHSNFSDGLSPVEDVVRRVKKVGLDGFALTDHDTIRGHKIAKREAKKFGLEFIPGIEVSSNEGHILGLGVQELVKKGPAAEVIEQIRDQGGVAIAAHPYDIIRSGVGDLVRKLKFDYIETFNARTLTPWINKKAKKVAEELKLKETAGSDAHMLQEIGFATVKVESIEDLYKGKAKIASKRWIGYPLISIEISRRYIRKYLHSKRLGF